MIPLAICRCVVLLLPALTGGRLWKGVTRALWKLGNYSVLGVLDPGSLDQRDLYLLGCPKPAFLQTPRDLRPKGGPAAARVTVTRPARNPVLAQTTCDTRPGFESSPDASASRPPSSSQSCSRPATSREARRLRSIIPVKQFFWSGGPAPDFSVL